MQFCQENDTPVTDQRSFKITAENNEQKVANGFPVSGQINQLRSNSGEGDIRVEVNEDYTHQAEMTFRSQTPVEQFSMMGNSPEVPFEINSAG